MTVSSDVLRPSRRESRRNVTKLVIIAAFLLMAIWANPRPARAVDTQIRIYSSLEPGSGLFEYGRHFDESNVAFGARDFNFSGDDGAAVYLRLNLVRNQTYPIRYHYWPSDQNACTQIAKLQQYIGGQWIEIGGTELHFIHMASRVSEGYTSSISSAGQTIGQYLGTIGSCDTSYPHSHMSGDIGTTSLMTMGSVSNDTCWTNLEYSFQCPGSYPDHITCSSSGSLASISGNITEYICETWSIQYRSTSDVIFIVSY